MIDPNYAETLFNYLYGNVNGYKVSNDARAKFSNDTSQFLYGEVPFETWKQIVERTNPKDDAVFFDLGSGTGRIVIQSYLLFNFRKVTGVELLEGLHNKACDIQEKFEKGVHQQIAGHLANREMNFVNGDIFQTDLRDADFIFMNHPIKDSAVFLQLEQKILDEVKPGTKITTTIRALRNPRFKSQGNQTYKFSWGDSTAYFYEV